SSVSGVRPRHLPSIVTAARDGVDCTTRRPLTAPCAAVDGVATRPVDAVPASPARPRRAASAAPGSGGRAPSVGATPPAVGEVTFCSLYWPGRSAVAGPAGPAGLAGACVPAAAGGAAPAGEGTRSRPLM